MWGCLQWKSCKQLWSTSGGKAVKSTGALKIRQMEIYTGRLTGQGAGWGERGAIELWGLGKWQCNKQITRVSLLILVIAYTWMILEKDFTKHLVKMKATVRLRRYLFNPFHYGAEKTALLPLGSPNGQDPRWATRSSSDPWVTLLYPLTLQSLGFKPVQSSSLLLTQPTSSGSAFLWHSRCPGPQPTACTFLGVNWTPFFCVYAGNTFQSSQAAFQKAATTRLTVKEVVVLPPLKHSEFSPKKPLHKSPPFPSPHPDLFWWLCSSWGSQSDGNRTWMLPL